jgi:hypothetical protein
MICHHSIAEFSITIYFKTIARINIYKILLKFYTVVRIAVGILTERLQDSLRS